MSLFDTVKTLFNLTVRRPGEAASQLLSRGWPIEAGWLTLILSAALTGILIGAVDQVSPVPLYVTNADGLPTMRLSLSPLAWMIQSLVGAVALTGSLKVVGGLFGGTGRFPEALWLVAWLEIFIALVMLAIIVMTFAMPLLGLLGMIVGIIVIVRAMGYFTRALHGFDTMGRAAIVLVLAFVTTSLLTSPLMTVLAREIPLETQ